MSFEVHSDWDAANWDRLPTAGAIGPFAGRPMLQVWSRLRSGGEPALVEGLDSLLPLERAPDGYRLLGEPDLFDYHSPLGSGAAKLISAWGRSLPAGTVLDFDSLPGEAADDFMAGLTDAGLDPTASVHESAAVIELPESFTGYLGALDKKQRHETRRKARRFTEALGEPRLIRRSGAAAVDRFVTMHRLAGGRKGRFMDPAMEAYFLALHDEVGGVIDFLHGDGSDPVAAAFGFEDGSAYYLYNSAYEPEASAASPGIVLVAELIRRAVDSGAPRFDFLKGDEVYKYRMGAHPRPLWRVQATVADS